MLHAWTKYGLSQAQTEFSAKFSKKHHNPKRTSPSFTDVVRGKIEFLGMVRGKTNSMYVKYRRQLRSLAPDLVADLEPPSNLDLIKKALWILESDGSQGTAFVLEDIGLITCAHVLGKNTMAFKATAVTERFPVRIIRQDIDLDLAILSIDRPTPDGLRMEKLLEPQYHDAITVAGLPNYRLGDSARIERGEIVGFRPWRAMQKILVSTSIVRGNSGGPVLNIHNNVIGVAVTGSDSMETASQTEDHGVIPISALKMLASGG